VAIRCPAGFKYTDDLVQHEALTMYLDAEPFNIPIHLWLSHIDIDHVPVDCFVIVWLEERKVVEVAERFMLQNRVRHFVCFVHP
jgi:hypothetical protein